MSETGPTGYEEVGVWSIQSLRRLWLSTGVVKTDGDFLVQAYRVLRRGTRDGMVKSQDWDTSKAAG